MGYSVVLEWRGNTCFGIGWAETYSKKTQKRNELKRRNTKGALMCIKAPFSIWRPQPDLNRCCRRERPVSWT